MGHSRIRGRMTRGASIALAILCILRLGNAETKAPPQRTLQQVVARWVEATGGAAALGAVRSAVVRGDATESGVSGTSEEWLSGDGYRRVTTEGEDVREEICRRGTCWIKDWNGKVLEWDGRDRRDGLTVAYIESLLYGGAVA